MRSKGGGEWYQNGYLHRIDGTAVVDFDDTEKWYLNGKLHREDGPAVVRENDGKFWVTVYKDNFSVPLPPFPVSDRAYVDIVGVLYKK